MSIEPSVTEQIRRQLGNPPADFRAERQRLDFERAIMETSPPPRRRGWLMMVPATALVATLVGVGVWHGAYPKGKELSFHVPGAAPPQPGRWVPVMAQAETLVDFSEGSMVSFAAGSSGQLMLTTEADVRIGLASGSVETDVTDKGKRRWAVEAGPYQVTALGTRFVVTWSPETRGLRVQVKEGRVRVEGPDVQSDTVVSAGAQLEFAPPEPPPEAPKPPAEEATVEETVQVKPTPISVPRQRPKARSWKALALAGDFASAVEAAEAAGLDTVQANATADELQLLADAARYARRPLVAKSALEMIRRRFKNSRHSVMAAYVLGRLLDEQLGEPAGAAGWLEVYLVEDPRGALAEEALGRQIELYRRFGHAEKARAAARTYLARFPAGMFGGVARAVAGN